MQHRFKYIFFFIGFLITLPIIAQKTSRHKLEARREQLHKDIVYINALLSNTQRKEKNLLNDSRDLNHKIKTREQLIQAISDESKEISNEIYLNHRNINQNQKELKQLKRDYADMIYNSYKSKSQQSRIMFLLSSENFYQGYKRFQYMKQYTQYRKKQGEDIQEKTRLLTLLNDTLKFKKQEKQELLDSKKVEQEKIESEKLALENTISQMKRKESKYRAQIKQFQKEDRRVEAQIDKLIRAAIASSNKSSGTNTSGFALTSEAKVLASQFVSNKGKLPWPVEKGYLTMRYGKQPHPIVKTATVYNSGVKIKTEKNSRARAVFGGTVMNIIVTSLNRKVVLIQHGNYITGYQNLQNVAVKKGDKVKTKESIGTVFTDKISGETILGFVLLKGTAYQNPASWIYRM